MGDLALAARERVLVHALERMGWQLLSAEIDLHRGTARVEVQGGSRIVILDARNGRATITREEAHVEQVTIGRKGDRTVVDRLRTRFVGRSRHEGPRSALRSFCSYLADNAPTGALPPARVRALFAPMMSDAHEEADRG